MKIEEEKVFDGSELQFLNVFGEWQNCPLTNKYRIKPDIDYSKEISMLQDKARTNGFKAVISFEKL